jgi:hypothetical protein
MDKKPKAKDTYKPFLLVVGAIVIAVLGFFGGVSFEKGHRTSASSTTAGIVSQSGSGRFGGRFGGGARVIGTVTAISATSISVQDTATNSVKTLAITSSTQITDNGQSVSYTDVTVGANVFVSEDTSNTANAARILVNPSFGGQGGAQAPSSSTPPSTTSD